MKKLIPLLSIFILISCSSEDSTNDDNPNNNNPDTELAENVKVISAENSQLTSTEAELEQGIYKITFTGTPPEILANDILVGDEGNGFLRRVSSVSVSGNTLTIQTTQGTLEDVFNEATIEFTTDLPDSFGPNNNSQDLKINYLAKGVKLSSDGFQYEFLNLVLYENGPITFEISGNATFNPNFSFKSEYTFFGGLDYLDFRADNANLALDCLFSLNASSGESIPEFSRILADFDKKITILVAGVPLIIIVNTTLEAKLNAGIEAQMGLSAGFTNSYLMSTRVTYENDTWTGDFDLDPSLSTIPLTLEGQVNLSQNLTITPRVSLKFYGIIGPYCQPEMTEDLVLNVASPSFDWDSNLKAGLDITTGVDIEVFGHVVADFNREDNFEETIWNAPDRIEIVSGNNQTGTQGQQLDDPLKVKVTDNFGNAIPLANVYFTTTEGNGTVNNPIVMTDANGFTEVLWTLGDGVQQTAEVNVKKADGTVIENGTLSFVATAEEVDFDVDLSGIWILTYEVGPCTEHAFSMELIIEGDTIQMAGVEYPWVLTSSNISFNDTTQELNFEFSNTYSESDPSYYCESTQQNFDYIGSIDAISFTGILTNNNNFEGFASISKHQPNCPGDDFECLNNEASFIKQ